MNSQRLDAASHALGLIMPGYQFDATPGKHLRIVNPNSKHYPDVVWRLRSDGLWPISNKACHVSGGTNVQAVCQLVHWMYDRPRRPIRCWKHWYGAESEVVKYLLTTDYPVMTSCIHCGNLEPGDWWMLKEKMGPCCHYGRCLNPERNPTPATKEAEGGER